MKMKLVQQLLRTEVTCLALTDYYVVTGMGGFVSIFNLSSLELITHIRVFTDAKVHGICEGPENCFLIFGGKQLAIICLKPDCNKVVVQTSWHLDDWILCAQWLEDKNIAIATAHNFVILWDWKNEEKILTSYCKERCILYSCSFVGCKWRDLAVLAGTVFQEVIIWAPDKMDPDSLCPVLHRLQGHKGVIFSSNYNPETGYIHTTSDDRSVKGWQVNPFQPSDWKLAEIKLIYTLYGHTARVWKSIGLKTCTISAGEDSQICIWSKEGNLLKQLSMHQGGSIWSIACCEQKRILVTGGSDGGINLLSLDYCMKNQNPVLHVPFDETCIKQRTELMIPRRVVVLKDGQIIVVLQSGHVVHCKIERDTTELVRDQCVCEIDVDINKDCPSIGTGAVWTVFYFSPKLASYCLLEVSLCRKRIALASLDGHLLIFESKHESDLCKLNGSPTKIIDMPAVDGKIFSLQWLSSNDILTCEALGKLTLWSLQTLGGSSWDLWKIRTFILPNSKERWVTAALRVNTFLVCGDRGGSIHLYSLIDDKSENLETLHTLSKVHGRLGVSSLMVYNDCIYSSGRDGCLRQYQILEKHHAIKQLCATRMSFDWVSSVCVNERDIIVLGFHEKNFVVWSQQQQHLLFEVPCGGGHRSWDYVIKENVIYFIHIKNKRVFLTFCDLQLSMKPFLQTGFHSKEVNCLQLFTKNLNFPLLLSGGEDTTIHVTAAFDQNKFHTLVVMHSHISSIRAIAYCEINKNKILMFSAGGRAQIKAWELTVEDLPGSVEFPPKLLYQELSSHMLMDQNSKQSKSWKNVQPSIDPETRYMCLCIVSYNNLIFVAVGCSDGYFRVFHFCQDQQKFELTGSFDFHHRCILNVACVAPLKVLTMATDGIVAFWDLSSLVQSHTLTGTYLKTSESKNTFSESSMCMPFSNHKLHQSGIDSYDLLILQHDHILLATGGDDTALAVTAYKFLHNPESVIQNLQWRMESAHVAQITGLAFVNKYLISSSVDQRVFVWKWICDLERRLLLITKVAEYNSAVADIKGLKAWPIENSFSLCVYGKGVEIIQENSTEH